MLVSLEPHHTTIAKADMLLADVFIYSYADRQQCVGLMLLSTVIIILIPQINSTIP